MMLATGAALSGTLKGANGASTGKYRLARWADGTRRNWRFTRCHVAFQPRERRLAVPRRIRPSARCHWKRTSAREIDIPVQLQLSRGEVRRPQRGGLR